MEQLKNPFAIYGYKGAEYFCDRKKPNRNKEHEPVHTVSFDELPGNKNCASMVKTTGDAHANQSTVSETLALWPRFIEPLFLETTNCSRISPVSICILCIDKSRGTETKITSRAVRIGR